MPKGFGCPIEVNLREVLNGIFYVQRTGCQWEMLPHDLPPYTTRSVTPMPEGESKKYLNRQQQEAED